MKNVEDVYPLSSMQELMLSYFLSAPDSALLCEQGCYTLGGNLDVVTFKRAWEHVVDRHAILRTAFLSEDLPQPLQVVREHVRLPWQEHDWRAMGDVQQRERLDALLEADQQRRFNLAEAPLMRLALIRVGEDAYLLVCSVHHVLLDKWSGELVMKEVLADYEAFSRGKDSPLAPPRPYRDYIGWLEQQDMSKAEAFWRKTLEGFAAPTPLAEDGDPEALDDQPKQYGAQGFELEPTTTAALESLARQHRLTLNTAVQGALALLLMHQSGQSDVVFGVTVSGRPATLEGVGSMVGLFINNLPMRARVSEEDASTPVVDWLKKLHAEQYEIQQYEYTPLALVQQWSEVPGHLPLFESLLVFQNVTPLDRRSREQGHALDIRPVRDTIRTNYPLTVLARPDERLSLEVIFDCSRFDAETISGALRDMKILLEGFAADPARQLEDVAALLGPSASTSHGNVDSRKPCRRDRLHTASREDYVPPRTPTERAVAQIWQELLDLERIGLNDDFFKLGAHSLLAVRLTYRLKQDLGVEVSVHALFEAPTVAGVAELVEKARREQQEDDSKITELTRQDRDSGDLPLSFAQQRLWFLDQLEPGNAAYNIHFAVPLKIPLNPEALQRSLNEIIRRHEILRTTFPVVHGQPVQHIAGTLTLSLPLVDLSSQSEPDQDVEVRRIGAQQAETSFDLAKGPLIRATLLRLGEARYRLLLTMHHIVTDGWSQSVLLRELDLLYEAFSNGAPSPLPEPAIQYADFAAWQRQWLQGSVREKLLDFWREQLADLPTLELPTDRPRPMRQSFRSARESLVLPNELSNRLDELSRQEGVTPFMTLLAALTVLLHGHSGQDDVIVGSPIANRNRPETENLMGFFVNMLSMRTNMAGNPTFCELLSRVRNVALDAYANQELPFEMVVDELAPDRDLSRNPLFQVTFGLQDVPASKAGLENSLVADFSMTPLFTRFDLEVQAFEVSDGLRVDFIYNTDLFFADRIQRMAAGFQALLEGVAADPNRRLSELPVLSEDERRRVLVAFNQTATDYPPDKTIQDLFEQQVIRAPEAVAVVFEGEQLTYGELNARANRLAHHLRTLGVGSEDLVAVCMERSLEMVTALYAILKAGGAYVPLDPDYPKQRLAMMLEETRAAVLLTQEKFVSALPPHEGSALCVDRAGTEVEQQPASNLPPRAQATNLAYVIYTSGSTGRPKGAMITHRAIVNRLLWMQETFALTQGDCVLQKTPFTFDVSVWEFFWPLLTGARLVVALPGGHKDADYLTEVIQREQVTTIHFVPSMLEVFLQHADVTRCRSLKRVICSGEALSVDLVRRFFDRSNAELHNLYGPTEAAVDVTWHACRRDDSTTVPIGKPIANTQLYILDRQLRPVPVGVTGELHIGGVQVARGYLNRPELTGERFIRDPFSPAADARLYKTGDLCRWLLDGSIEYLGRGDHQVKIRGFRVELGEIETVLGRHPAVREVVVLAREDQPGAKRLVAYVVAAGPTPSLADWRRFLKAELPNYMVPSAFVLVDAIPLNPSGKIDRKALPKPEQTRTEEAGEFVAPKTPAERSLADIWADVLKLDRVGINDNFFELGGDSILIIQVVARAADAGIRLKANQTFRHQTIAELAAQVSFSPEESVVTDQGPVTGAAPLTPIGKWFFEQDPVDAHHFNQTVILELREEVASAVMERSVRALVEHHDALRLRCVREGNDWRQEHLAPESVTPFDVVDLSDVDADSQIAMIEKKAAQLQSSFSLASGPLVRFVLFDLGGDRAGRLLIAAHHLVIDGVSWRILVEDLEDAYLRLREGRPVSLPARTTSFKRWGELLAEEAQSEATQNEADYWLSLAWDQARPLPVDFQRRHGMNTVASASTVTVELDAEETRSLLQEVPAVYQTQVNDVLLTALAQANRSWTGSDAVVVHLEGHGREELSEDVNLSRTVGWFTSMFPVLLNLTGVSGPGEAIKSIKEQLRQIPRRGIGYGLLRYLRDDSATRDSFQRLPRAQICFNYLGRFNQVFDASRLFRRAAESVGPMRSPRMIQPHELEIDGMIVDGCLRFTWAFSTAIHRPDTITQPAHHFIEALRALIDHCRSPEAGGYTPSDFPKAKISQEELDGLSADMDDDRGFG